ncbi:MAG: hypothetical protein AB1782_13835 [Cyanobacteriota bacterium]
MIINSPVSFGARLCFDKSVNQKTREELVKALNEDQLDTVKKSGDYTGCVQEQIPFISDIKKDRDVSLTLKVDEKRNTLSAVLGGVWDKEHEKCRIAEDQIYGIKVVDLKPETIGKQFFMLINRLILDQVWKLSAEEREELGRQRTEYWNKQKKLEE